MTVKEYFNQASAEDVASALMNMVSAWLLAVGKKEQFETKEYLAFWDSVRDYWDDEMQAENIASAERKSELFRSYLKFLKGDFS